MSEQAKRELVITLPDGTCRLGSVVLNGQDISQCVQRIELDINTAGNGKPTARITYRGGITLVASNLETELVKA